jgi:hypothetical protein
VPHLLGGSHHAFLLVIAIFTAPELHRVPPFASTNARRWFIPVDHAVTRPDGAVRQELAGNTREPWGVYVCVGAKSYRAIIT